MLDMASDGFRDESYGHLVIEGAIFLASAWAFIILFGRIRQSAAVISIKNVELSQKQADAERWKKRANVFLTGLGAEIQAQFDHWLLTRTEKEIALYLIKGFSHKEIAQLTDRSERTIRQHAGEVYQKGGLNGRAELAAFFLEDLLSPSNLSSHD
jgi:DNA-binding CsgD family transcriptional regulator